MAAMEYRILQFHDEGAHGKGSNASMPPLPLLLRIINLHTHAKRKNPPQKMEAGTSPAQPKPVFRFLSKAPIPNTPDNFLDLGPEETRVSSEDFGLKEGDGRGRK